ncbi:MAG: sigma-70 family RNA polymerase sigma factor [Planctomycetota bacterium]
MKLEDQQVGARDRATQERLWRAERRWVAAVLLAHMPRGADLEDLLQEVAVIFVERLESLRDPARLRGWLRSVALNVARGAGRRARFPRSLESARHFADPAPERALQRVEAREEATHVLEVAASLPLPYREPLLLRAVKGLSQKRIAEILALPETTVETRLARARKMLRERLEVTRRVGPSEAG